MTTATRIATTRLLPLPPEPAPLHAKTGPKPGHAEGYSEKINHDICCAFARRQDLYALMEIYGRSIGGGLEAHERFQQHLTKLHAEHKARKAERAAQWAEKMATQNGPQEVS